MQVIHDLDWIPDLAAGSVVTIGEFDGVHRGHRVVLHEVSQRAAVLGCPTVVVTFDRDPQLLTTPDEAPPHLTDLDHKLELLASTGVDIAVVLPAERVARIPDPETGVVDDDDTILGRLIDEVLIGALHMRAIIVGENFHFGERRRSTIEMLDERSAALEFEVVRFPVSARLTTDGDVISSTAIRKALSGSDVALAQSMLGRPYELRSTVAVGARRGRTIGFPTANLPAPAAMQLPGDGVYAGWFFHDGNRFAAAVNVGRRPTFYDSSPEPLVEAHLLGFRGDLYGEPVKLSFVQHLRHERKFSGANDLTAQLRRDVDEVAALLPW